MCHNVTEFEKVEDSELGQPGVIWNGSEYARIKSTEWQRIDLNAKLIIETQIISKKTDADIKVEFEFEHGYVVSHKPSITLIDNTERLSHDKKVKEFAIKRAKKFNSTWYKIYNKLFRTPMQYAIRSIGYLGSYLQDLSWKLERQLNK